MAQRFDLPLVMPDDADGDQRRRERAAIHARPAIELPVVTIAQLKHALDHFPLDGSWATSSDDEIIIYDGDGMQLGAITRGCGIAFGRDV